MTKKEYLHELEKELRTAGVRDSADILEEYSVHFDMKAADGYGEEEVAARLASPEEIAAQFVEAQPHDSGKIGGRIVSAVGLFFADLFVGSFFIILYAWVITLAALAISCAAVGGLTVMGITGKTSGGVMLIPDMPYICALLLGISFLALAVMSAIGTEYCRLYITQIVRVYARWHKGVCGKSKVSPPLPMHPVMSPKRRRKMRSIALIAIVVFAVAFIAGLGSMMIASGSIQPWHVWHWFES